MKNNCWLILGAMLSTSLLAQQATNPPPSAPIETPAAAPAATLTPTTAKTNAPVAKAGKKKAGKKKAVAKKKAPARKAPALVLKTVPLVAGPAMVVASNVNVRGQAKLKSEVVTRVTKGQSVTVIEEIVRNNSGPDEPSAWAKVLLPPNAHVWVNTMFINSSNQTVKPKKLNVRSGPGENYSVVGLMHAGDALKPVTTKGDWTEIEPPANAYGFMAAQYLSQEAPAMVAAVPPVAPNPTEAPVVPPPTATPSPTTPPATPMPTEPAPTPAIVAATPPVAPPPAEAPVVPPPTEMPAPTVTPAVTPAVTNAIVATPPEPEEEEPPPPRIVQREGIVRGMTSIQAPSKFALISPENGKDIDYLYTTSAELDLRRYKGLRIVVTGEEGLDERWGNTPVLTIQKIQIVE
jgi:uncharacterized protein YgiM (DUF1202 family)